MASQAVENQVNRVARVPRVRVVNHITCLRRALRATCFRSQVKSRGIETAEGIFGAMMQVSLVNDGPVTLVIDRD